MSLALFDPCRLAVFAATLLVVVLFFIRRLGLARRDIERCLIAAFLVSMPFVYLARALMAGAQSWISLEILAVPLFSSMAFLGLKKSPWFLVAGIASHGLAWDAWHHGTSPYIPNWYSAACLIFDVALAGYLCSRIVSDSKRTPI